MPIHAFRSLTLRTTYVGPGDVVSGAVGWWGLRAYSLAKAGTAAIRLRASGDDAQSDFNTLSNGNLDTASISSFKATHGGNLFVTKLYDQSGGTNDLVQATAANQPPFSLSILGSLPAIDNTAGGSVSLRSGNVTQTQPFSWSMVYNRTSFGGDCLLINEVSSNLIQIVRGVLGGANNTALFAGSNFNAAAADATWHGIQMLVNAASSKITVDGSDTTGDASTSAYSATPIDFITGAGLAFSGYVSEFGLWGSDVSASFSALNSNQHSYWGF